MECLWGCFAVPFWAGNPSGFRPGNESFRLGNESFRHGNESFCLGNESFCLGNESFCPGNESFCPGNESFRLGNESFCLGNESFRLRNESIRIGPLGFPMDVSLMSCGLTGARFNFSLFCLYACAAEMECRRTQMVFGTGRLGTGAKVASSADHMRSALVPGSAALHALPTGRLPVSLSNCLQSYASNSLITRPCTSLSFRSRPL